MNKFAKELLLLIFVILPYVFLTTIWDQLPQQIPTHFDLQGTPNDWSDKSFFLWFPGVLGLGIYLMMLALPKLDPKKKLAQMGNTYASIRILIGAFICGTTIYLMYSASVKRIDSPNFIFFLVGLLIAVFGNYFQTLKHNYFIGIRTPWTLESERVWKETHVLGGRLWVIGGLLMVVLSLLKINTSIIMPGFISIILLITLIPVVYSYLRFKKIDHSPGL